MKTEIVIASILFCTWTGNGYGIAHCENINAIGKLDEKALMYQHYFDNTSSSLVIDNLIGVNKFDSYYIVQNNGTVPVNSILDSSEKTEKGTNDVLSFGLGAAFGHIILLMAYGSVFLSIDRDFENIPIWFSATFFATIPIGSIVGGYLITSDEGRKSPLWLTALFSYLPSIIAEVMLYYFIQDKWDRDIAVVCFTSVTFLGIAPIPLLAVLGFYIGKCLFVNKKTFSNKLSIFPDISIECFSKQKYVDIRYKIGLLSYSF